MQNSTGSSAIVDRFVSRVSADILGSQLNSHVRISIIIKLPWLHESHRKSLPYNEKVMKQISRQLITLQEGGRG